MIRAATPLDVTAATSRSLSGGDARGPHAYRQGVHERDLLTTPDPGPIFEASAPHDEPMLVHFGAHGQHDVEMPWCALAYYTAATFPRCPERTVVLRKLLESMDALRRVDAWQRVAATREGG